MTSRKVVNKNVSSTTKVSSETVAQLQHLRLVSRFHNLKQRLGMHGNQRAHAWNIFGYLIHETDCDQDGEVVASTKYKLRTCEVVVTQIEFEIF